MPMKLLSFFPAPVGVVHWRCPGPMRTVIVKSTFSLATDGDAPFATEQEPLSADRPGRHPDELVYPSDFVPFKPVADILLTGNAHAEVPSRVIGARLFVHGIDKVFFAVGTTESKAIPLLPSHLRAGPSPAAAPVRVGALAPWSAVRAEFADPRLFEPQGPPRAPLPAGFDFRFFNSAPADQQVRVSLARLHVGLEGLLKGVPSRWVRLPNTAPRVFLLPAGGDPAAAAPHEVEMRRDTLWIDTDRAVCTLVWRGVVAGGPESLFVVTATDRGGSAATWAAIAPRLREATPSPAVEMGHSFDEMPSSTNEEAKPPSSMGLGGLRLGSSGGLRLAGAGAPPAGAPPAAGPPGVETPGSTYEVPDGTEGAHGVRSDKTVMLTDHEEGTALISVRSDRTVMLAGHEEGTALITRPVQQPGALARAEERVPPEPTPSPPSSGRLGMGMLGVGMTLGAGEAKEEPPEITMLTPDPRLARRAPLNLTALPGEASGAQPVLPFHQAETPPLPRPAAEGVAALLARRAGLPFQQRQSPPAEPTPASPPAVEAPPPQSPPAPIVSFRSTLTASAGASEKPVLPFQSPGDAPPPAWPEPKGIAPRRAYPANELTGLTILPIGSPDKNVLPFRRPETGGPPAAALPSAPPLLAPEVYARVKASLWASATPVEEVLAAHGLREDEWRMAERHFTEALSRKAQEGQTDKVLALSEAFSKAGAVPVDSVGEIPLDEYAQMRVLIDASDDCLASVLASRGLSAGAFRQIEQHWRARAEADPAIGEALRAKLSAARRARGAWSPEG